MPGMEKETGVKSYENDQELMRKVLSVYFPNTRYLLNEHVKQCGDPSKSGKLVYKCEFSIPESCYINDTGHFNSVEFNICYNQMMYYGIAKSVKHGFMDIFRDWELEDFWRKQLPNILIVNFQSIFKKPIQSKKFYGEIDFTRTRKRTLNQQMYIIDTQCRFFDEASGYSEGKVGLVVLN